MTRYPRTSLEYPWTLDGATERANISIMMPEFQDLQMIGTTSVSEKYRQKEGILIPILEGKTAQYLRIEDAISKRCHWQELEEENGRHHLITKKFGEQREGSYVTFHLLNCPHGNLVVPGSREEIAILKPNLDEKAAEPQESLDPIVGNMTCVFVQAIDILVPEKLIADKQCVNCHSLIGLLHLLESIERSGCSPPPWPE
ncbi:hypothetical protein GH733_001902 [Mirounga leonina]|nr:hypothetical protein GH733_001902 [Mirounga leonina]